MPRVEKVSARRPETSAVEKARAALREGKVVLLPTETVYGLVGRPEVLARLGVAGDSTRLVAGTRDIESETGALPRMARALADRFWPGPLTLVLPRKKGETGAYRVPGLQFARQVVACDFPVAAAGDGEPTSCEAALASLGDRVDLAFDAGPALLARPSTVVSVAARGYEVVREGWLSKAEIARALARTVLFVCTGNTCRSPMAEAIFKARLADRLGVAREKLVEAGFTVHSAGTNAMQGGPAADQAIQVMEERGIELESHRSRNLTPALVDEAEVIYVMSSSHARTIEEWFPEAASKVRLLDPQGVPDPVGQSVECYRETASLLEQRIEEALDEIL